jgi:drug/metabolite transporter (DMT)-like permease
MDFVIMIFMFAIWTSIFSLGKLALMHSAPLFLTAARMILAGIILLIFLLITKRKALKIEKKQFLSLILFSILSIYLTNAFEFWGLQHLSAAKTCFIYSLSPFLSALLSYVHFGEKMNAKKWLGMLLGFTGFIPVMTMQTGTEGLVGGLLCFSWPELALIGATVASVYGWIILRLLVRENSMSPLTVNGYSMLLGGFFALINSFCVDRWTPIPIETGFIGEVSVGLLIMTFISNILCYNLYGWLLKRFTATFLTFVGLLSPIFASINGWLFLGEMPSWQILLSTTIVACGLWIVYQAELKQGYIVQKPKKATKESVEEAF